MDLSKATTEQLAEELTKRSKDLTIEGILYNQLTQLRGLSQSDPIKDEPELVVQISLAMAEIAKWYLF